MTSKSSTGSRPDADDTSMTCTSTFVRSRCARNFVPSPCPSCAPSISPGTSATTKLRSSLEVDDAEIRRERRERVVGDLRPRGGDARDQRALAGVRKSDETDVGEQLQPQPQRCASSPGLPGSVRRGARLVDVANAALPRPPRPPRATSTRSPTVARSASGIRSSPCLLVDDRAGRHFEDQVRAVAAGAVRALAVLAALGLEFGMEAVGDERVLVRAGDEVDRAAACRRRRRSGRRAARASRGGRPCSRCRRRRPGRGCRLRRRTSNFRCRRLLLDRLNADHAAVRAVVGELHAAGDLREQRVVLAAADVQAGPEPPAALADENRAAGHEVAVESLDAEPLRIAVAPVA